MISMEIDFHVFLKINFWLTDVLTYVIVKKVAVTMPKTAGALIYTGVNPAEEKSLKMLILPFRLSGRLFICTGMHRGICCLRSVRPARRAGEEIFLARKKTDGILFRHQNLIGGIESGKSGIETAYS